jgi:hypothetical protein
VPEEDRPPLVMGVPENWDAFHRRNAAFVEASLRIYRLCGPIFLRTLRNPSTADSSVFYLGRICVDDFSEIVLVCGNGLEIAGKKLLRGLFERGLTAWYLHKHPDEARNFQDYWSVQLDQLTREAVEKFGASITEGEGQEAVESIRVQAIAMRERFMIPACEKCKTRRLNPAWTRLDVASTSRECPEIGEYFIPAYRDTLAHVHANFGGVIQRLGVKGNLPELQPDGSMGPLHLAFEPEVSPETCDAVLIVAHAILLRVLELQIRHFGLDHSQEPFNTCVEEFTAVWKRQPRPKEEGRP